MRSIAHQLCSEPVDWAFQHAKGLSEYQIAHNVKHQPLTPMSCVPLIIPALVVCALLCDAALCPLVEHFATNSYVCQYVFLQALDRRVTESMAHDSSLAGMLCLINSRVHADSFRRAREGFVKARLSHITSEAIDSLQAGSCVDR